jgi:hypothetical protein
MRLMCPLNQRLKKMVDLPLVLKLAFDWRLLSIQRLSFQVVRKWGTEPTRATRLLSIG